MADTRLRALIGLAAMLLTAASVAGCAGAAAGAGAAGAAGAAARVGPLQRLGTGLGRLRDGLINRNGNFPGLERGKRLLALNDPENLKSDNPAVKEAAQQKADADAQAQKIKAIKYLGMIGCGCDTSIRDSLEASLEDCDEVVRYAACKAFTLSARQKCAACNFKSCCSRKVLDKLWKMGYDRKDNGCYFDPSPKVRSAAREAFKACKKNCLGLDEKEPEKPQEGQAAPEGKTTYNERKIQGGVFHFPGFDWVIEDTAPPRPLPDAERRPTPAGPRPAVVRSPGMPTEETYANRPARLMSEYEAPDEEETTYQDRANEQAMDREAAELAAEQGELEVLAARWLAEYKLRRKTAPPTGEPDPRDQRARIQSEGPEYPAGGPVRPTAFVEEPVPQYAPAPQDRSQYAPAQRDQSRYERPLPPQGRYAPPHAGEGYYPSQEYGGPVPQTAHAPRPAYAPQTAYTPQAAYAATPAYHTPAGYDPGYAAATGPTVPAVAAVTLPPVVRSTPPEEPRRPAEPFRPSFLQAAPPAVPQMPTEGYGSPDAVLPTPVRQAAMPTPAPRVVRSVPQVAPAGPGSAGDMLDPALSLPAVPTGAFR